MVPLRVSATVRLRAFALELDLEVGAETFGLVGPSGAGKSTTLRAIAGLVRPERGVVSVDGAPWFDAERSIDLPPERRSVGLLFQDYALFPHLTVEQNVRYGGSAKLERLLESFGLVQLRGERPERLSGGERQRVALARALAREPRVLLLDEPLGALDARTRAEVRADLRARLRAAAIPTVLVTHDYEDAAALADRIGVLVDGRIVQVGTPAQLVAAPASPFVAQFTGANVVAGTAQPGADGLTRVTLDDGTSLLVAADAAGDVGVVVYPWEIALAREAPVDSMQNHVRGRVEGIVTIGNRVRVRVGPLTAEITARAAEELELAEGDVVVASFKATGARVVPYA